MIFRLLNQGKIFEIVIHNLLYRDGHIGTLSAGDRYHFLKSFAILLQQSGHSSFAGPEEIRSIVEKVFAHHLRRTDSREQLLEQYYRTCRRHSGLTTESQFQDTTGQLDLPVEEEDTTSRVGFSHNSLREYLVAEAFSDYVLNSTYFEKLNTAIITDSVSTFFADLAVYSNDLLDKISVAYRECQESILRERLFRLIIGLISRDAENNLHCLGEPPKLNDLDLSGIDLSALPLVESDFTGSIFPETDLRNTNLSKACFSGAILERTMLDGATLDAADFREAEVESIFVFDEFDSKTSSILSGKEARQWLFSHGAMVGNSEDLNPLLGKPWYEAAREVTRTLERRIAGTHQDVSLSKGTALSYRAFSAAFVSHLRARGVLVDVKRSKKGSMVVKVAQKHRGTIKRFNDDGIIDGELQLFFDKYIVNGE